MLNTGQFTSHLPVPRSYLFRVRFHNYVPRAVRYGARNTVRSTVRNTVRNTIRNTIRSLIRHMVCSTVRTRYTSSDYFIDLVVHVISRMSSVIVTTLRS